MTKTNAIYVCSKDERAIQKQIQFMTTQINNKNSDVIIYSDNTLNDYHKTGYAALTTDIRFNKIDKLFVTSLESLTTNVKKLAGFCEILNKFDVELVVINTALSDSPVCIQTVDSDDNSHNITIEDWDDEEGFDDDVMNVVINKMLNK